MSGWYHPVKRELNQGGVRLPQAEHSIGTGSVSGVQSTVGKYPLWSILPQDGDLFSQAFTAAFPCTEHLEGRRTCSVAPWGSVLTDLGHETYSQMTADLVFEPSQWLLMMKWDLRDNTSQCKVWTLFGSRFEPTSYKKQCWGIIATFVWHCGYITKGPFLSNF